MLHSVLVLGSFDLINAVFYPPACTDFSAPQTPPIDSLIRTSVDLRING